jgi:hypothetical protein
MKRGLTVWLILYGFCSLLYAQDASLLWLKSGKVYTGGTYPCRIATYPNLNDFYFYGNFTNTFELGTFRCLPVRSYPEMENLKGYLAKFDRNGNILQFSHFGDTASMSHS